MARPRTPLLDRDRIADGALALVDRDGDFTIPELARHLGVQPASLYHHVEGRGGIIELIRARVIAAVDTSAFATLPWDEALRAWAHSYRDAFAAHAGVIRLLATETIREPSSLDMYEQAVTSLEEAGFPEDSIMAVITALESFLLGSALDLVAPATMVAVGGDQPRLARALAATPSGRERADQAFELGLAALIDGFRALVDRRRQTAS